MAKQSARPKSLTSKYSAQYWEDRVFRPVYTRDGQRTEIAEWWVKIQYDGRREAVGLNTNNAEEASRKAAKLYQTVRSKGWAAALAEFRPTEGARSMLTVGDFIKAATPLLKARPRSVANYTYALRKVASDSQGLRNTSKARFDPKNLPWREAADKIPMAKITPESIEVWKAEFIGRAGDNPVLVQRARRSVNSFIRNARALFSRRMLKRFRELSIEVPPMPFEGVELERQGSTRYVSTIQPKDLLSAARKKLAKKYPETWKILILALGAGLRRSEIDGLCWTQVDFDRGEIRIINHATFEAKTDDSIGTVYVDPGLLAELKRLRGEMTSLFVVEPDLPAVQRKGQHYRCQEAFKKATDWLRKNGVMSDKPLHALRKEFGSIIAESADIHTASRQLRHSTISTTAAYYTDHRKKATVAIGEMLKARAK